MAVPSAPGDLTHSIPSLLARHLDDHRPALISGQAGTLSYRELATLVDAAREQLAERGIARGDRVGIVVPDPLTRASSTTSPAARVAIDVAKLTHQVLLELPSAGDVRFAWRIRSQSWDKNDPKDAQVILRLLKNGTTQRYLDPLVTGHQDLQEMAKTYQQVSLRKVRLQHSLVTHHLPLYFPEAER